MESIAADAGPAVLGTLTLGSLLIVKMSSIGDVVHALPVAVALRRKYPNVRISWVAEDWVAPLLMGHPAIDRVVVFPAMQPTRVGRAWMTAFRRGVRSLREESYDLSLDLQGLWKSSVVALLSAAPRRLGMHGQREGASLVSRPVPCDSRRLHVVEDYLQCARFLGAPATPVSFDLQVLPEAARAVDTKLAGLGVDHQQPLIVINPSSSARWKNWPMSKWARVGSALAANGTLVLVGSRAQAAQHAAVAHHASPPLRDLTGRTTLAELVALLNRSAVHIAPDTGSAHIAAALGRPVVGVYGPTVPWRKGPYGWESQVVSHAEACTVGCPRFCLLRQRCLRVVSPDEVIGRARRVLSAAA